MPLVNLSLPCRSCSGGIVFRYVALFSVRASIERYSNTVEPRGLRLRGVMTFFFSILYFEYPLHLIVQERRTAQLAQTPPPYQHMRSA